MHRIGYIVLAIAALTGGAFLFASPSAKGSLAPTDGTVDLRGWNFSDDGAVMLAGEWHYFDQSWAADLTRDEAIKPQIARVPGPWPAMSGASGNPRRDGYGTYRLKVRLPQPVTGERFALDTGYVLSAYRVRANGTVIAESGRPAADYQGERARAYSLVAPLPADIREVTIDMEISNHLSRYGGTFAAPTIGYESTIRAHRTFLEATSLILIGAMFFAALYHLAVFALTREGLASLTFGIYAALMGVRTFLIEPLATHSVPWLGQDWVWRIDFAVSMLLLPAAYWFFATSFPRHIARAPLAWVVAACGGGAGLTLALGPAFGEFAMKVFEIFAIGPLVYFSIGLVAAARGGERGSRLALTGWLISAVAVIHDILMDLGVIAGINLIPFGFIAFFLCLSGALAARFHSNYRRAEELSQRLTALNEGLERVVEERTLALSDKIGELQARKLELEKAKADAESANIAKSRFLATMSHELRTPLNAILGFSEIIHVDQLSPDSKLRDKEYAGLINESGRHLLSLITDILDLSKIEAGKKELVEESLDLSEVVADALRLVGLKSTAPHCEITTDLPASLPSLRADRRATIQMIVNLASNAVKFTPKTGEIIVSAALASDGGIIVVVKDNGMGMAPEDIPKALAAFCQVDDGHARTHEGTGLGLPIVKSLMELHGGKLVLEGARGTGTTAILQFPVTRTLHPRQRSSVA